MTNSKTLFMDLMQHIVVSETDDEKKAILYRILEKVAGITPTHIAAEKQVSLTPELLAHLHKIIKRVNTGEPLQYVIGESDFYGRTFKVNRDVLIPRPETEDLTRAALGLLQDVASPRLMDIGCGSGCIAITMALERPDASVYATDVSLRALEIARENAHTLRAPVDFQRSNILSEFIPVSDLDLVVSNPPYITPEEAPDMSATVLEHEPHLALFTESSDPLQYYRPILSHSRDVLNPGGMVIVEVNERFGNAVANLFREFEFTDVTVEKDSSGKQRMVHGIYPGKE
ncbi:MAG: peptide chain release factor N(5)-glutamine methyltransferase [Cyclobacteriaceae bacterium]|nr:peptide chain release factor N(5)-glutamine methyltransferase [Cyclobacteriaceae bacterium]